MWKTWALVHVHKQQLEHMQRRTAAVGLHEIRVESTSPIHCLQLKMQENGWPLLLHRLNGAIWHSQKVKQPSHESQPTLTDLFLKTKASPCFPDLMLLI